MKKYTVENFIDIIRGNVKALSLDDFKKTEQIGNLWDKFDDDDIRIKTLKTKENFYIWCYDLIHNDEFLKYFFEKRLKFVDIKPVPFLHVENKQIANKHNNAGFIRNLNLDGILNTSTTAGDSLKEIYKKALETGKMSRAFTMPSTFKETIKGNYEPLIVTLKTVSGHASIFSPSIYRALLEETEKYQSNKKQKLLLCTASWGSPIIALQESLHYSDVHVVDVQKDVLKTCEDIYYYLENDFFDSPYNIKTFCTPSEKMTNIIDKEYDKVFFCPPYYDLEVYGNSDEQSTTLYKTYDEWLEGYWRGTVKESFKVLNKDGIFSFTIGINICGHDMAKDMLEISKEYFEEIEEIKIIPAQEIKRDSNKLEKYEVCYILKKSNS